MTEVGESILALGIVLQVVALCVLLVETGRQRDEILGLTAEVRGLRRRGRGMQIEQIGNSHVVNLRGELRNRYRWPSTSASVDFASDRDQSVPDDVELNAQHLPGAAVSVDQFLMRLLRLQEQTLELLDELRSHESSPSVRDVEAATSPSVDPTLGDTADTSASSPSGSREDGGRGAATSSESAAPHFTKGDAR